MKIPHVSIDDLAFAATWMDAHDGGEGDDNQAAAERVSAWLRALIARREEDAAVRALVKETGAPATQVRLYLRRQANAAASDPTTRQQD